MGRFEIKPLLTLLAIAILSPTLEATNTNSSVDNINYNAISNKLREGFYNSTCPNVEDIVCKVIREFADLDRGIIPGLIRIHFHDCFITGCDASVLLQATKANNFSTELVVPANLSLRGIKAITKAKNLIEKQCPGVVSCADIIAFAARDAVALAGNPRYSIPAGRRDALHSHAYKALDIPSPIENITALREKFAKRGLTYEDMVVLEGSHSIGQAHCVLTAGDPNITDLVEGLVDKKFQSTVMKDYCKGEKLIFLEVTPMNPEKGDTDWGVSFYKNALKGEAILPSDLLMVRDPVVKDLVQRLSSNVTLWKQMFNEAMIKLGKINVLTDNEGEIRTRCGFNNADNEKIKPTKKK